MPTRTRTLTLAAIAALAAVALSGGVSRAGDRVVRPASPPSMPPAASFTARVDNPWFPLVPGTRYAYTGVKDGEPSRDIVTVTHRSEDDRRRPLRRRSGSPLRAWAARRAHDRLVHAGRVRATSGTSARTRPSSTEAAASPAPRARGRPASTAPGRASSCPHARASASPADRSSTRATRRTTSR